MKNILFLTAIIFTLSVKADETPTLEMKCGDNAYAQALVELVSNIRNKAGFEVGDLSMVKQDSEAIKNIVLLKQFNIDKELATYEASAIGTITNNANQKSTFAVAQCTVYFKGSDCNFVAKTCSAL